ncbi:hypothetical protein CMK11_14815 [Candidatus Poribacteria bacterium]|nr:hypothetical protein [Candidatus Poribacteria bacterium]
MDIREQDLGGMRELAPLYNAQIADTPFCYAVSGDEFAEGVTEWAHPEMSGRMRDQTVLVAVEGGEPVGFVHIVMGRVLEDWSEEAHIDCGAIRFITYPPGRRDVGQSLMDAAQRRLTGLGASRIHAFTKATAYRFYQLGFGLLPTAMGHIVGLLGMNGYTVRRGEYFLDRPDMEPTVPPPPDPRVKVTTECTEGRGDLPNLIVKARLGDADTGECECKSAGAYAYSPDAQRLFYVDWLGVTSEFRGQGWGSYLLLRALTEGRKLGYEGAVIATDWRNYRALLLYTNRGFRVASYAYDFYKAAAADAS